LTTTTLKNSAKVAQQIKDPVLLRKIAMQLKQLRRERNITQDIFFYDTNIHIARIETGKVNPSVSTLKAICNYFEISLVEFFDQVEAM
jgi:transcriptional regulator with XRE-family HTH domain